LRTTLHGPKYEEATADEQFQCERLQYSSGGLPVIAYVYRKTGTAVRWFKEHMK
jgi:hypothetical protein